MCIRYLLLFIFFCCIVYACDNTTNSKDRTSLYKTDSINKERIKPIPAFKYKEYSKTEKASKWKEINAEEKIYRLDTFFNKMGQWGDYNGTVLIAHQGQILFHKAYGWAVNDQLLNTIDTRFQLASVSKTITATLTLLLVQEKKIHLDSSVYYYLPELPYRDITIRQLLNHRSGLPNYTYFTDETYLNRLPDDYMNNDELLAYMSDCPPSIDYAPDQRFIYCNTNYALLASICSRANNSSFENCLNQKIFHPLGMNNSGTYTPRMFRRTKNYSIGYYINGREVANTYHDGVLGDKGIYSTVYDLYLLHEALQQGFINSTLLEEAYTNTVTEPQRIRKYGLGWRIRYDDDSNKIVYHNGWWHGYRTALHRRPEDGACVILLTNKLNRQVYDAAVQSFYILDNKIPIINNDSIEGIE